MITFDCGHEITDENTGWNTHDKKFCRICERKRQKEGRKRRKLLKKNLTPISLHSNPKNR